MIDPALLIASLMVASTPILLAAIGELVVERAGVLNLGVEGMMITGAICGIAAALWAETPWAGFLAAAIGGALLSLLFALLTQVLMSNQVATGLALTLFGLGLSSLIGQSYSQIRAPSLQRIDLGPLTDLPVVGRLLFGQDPMVYISLLIVAGTWAFLRFSRAGLDRCARWREPRRRPMRGLQRRASCGTCAIAFGGRLRGAGGAYLSLVPRAAMDRGMTGSGWIASPSSSSPAWKPWRCSSAAYLPSARPRKCCS